MPRPRNDSDEDEDEDDQGEDVETLWKCSKRGGRAGLPRGEYLRRSQSLLFPLSFFLSPSRLRDGCFVLFLFKVTFNPRERYYMLASPSGFS